QGPPAGTPGGAPTPSGSGIRSGFAASAVRSVSAIGLMDPAIADRAVKFYARLRALKCTCPPRDELTKAQRQCTNCRTWYNLHSDLHRLFRRADLGLALRARNRWSDHEFFRCRTRV